MIYFDNAATTFPKPKSVIKSVEECIKEYCGNPGRSAHYYAVKSSEKVYETREKISELINFDKPENVVFTLNATYALNIAIKTLLNHNDHVIVSDIEHNSVLRPIQKLKSELKIEYDVFDSSKEDLEDEISSYIKGNTKALICNIISNVTGKEISLKTLSKLRQKYNIKLIIDASQAMGHHVLDIKETPFDVLCAPSHKSLFGIQGAGFCVFAGESPNKTLIEGGSGSESLKLIMPSILPEKFEAGTLPTPALAALSTGINFVNDITLPEIRTKLDELTYRTHEIINSFHRCTVFGAENGIVSFSVNKIPSHIVADELSKNGICVRSGIHCAPLINKRLGTEESGTVRLSFSYLNRKKELDKFYKVLKDVINK